MGGCFLLSGRRRKSGAKTEESSLNRLCPCRDLRVTTHASSKTHDSIQLVYRSIGFDAKIGFGDADTAGKSGLSPSPRVVEMLIVFSLNSGTRWLDAFLDGDTEGLEEAWASVFDCEVVVEKVDDAWRSRVEKRFFGEEPRLHWA